MSGQKLELVKKTLEFLLEQRKCYKSYYFYFIIRSEAESEEKKHNWEAGWLV